MSHIIEKLYLEFFNYDIIGLVDCLSRNLSGAPRKLSE